MDFVVSIEHWLATIAVKSMNQMKKTKNFYATPMHTPCAYILPVVAIVHLKWY